MNRRHLAGVLLAALLAGCGTVDRRADAAAGTALDLLRSRGAGDGAAACAVLAPDTATSLEQSEGKPCATAILDEDLPPAGAVTGEQVYGHWAQVRVAGDTLFLAEFHDGWRVVAAGCTPGGAAPYDCTLRGG